MGQIFKETRGNLTHGDHIPVPYQLKDGIFGKIPCICSCVSISRQIG